MGAERGAEEQKTDTVERQAADALGNMFLGANKEENLKSIQDALGLDTTTGQIVHGLAKAAPDVGHGVGVVAGVPAMLTMDAARLGPIAYMQKRKARREELSGKLDLGGEGIGPESIQENANAKAEEAKALREQVETEISAISNIAWTSPLEAKRRLLKHFRDQESPFFKMVTKVLAGFKYAEVKKEPDEFKNTVLQEITRIQQSMEASTNTPPKQLRTEYVPKAVRLTDGSAEDTENTQAMIEFLQGDYTKSIFNLFTVFGTIDTRFKAANLEKKLSELSINSAEDISDELVQKLVSKGKRHQNARSAYRVIEGLVKLSGHNSINIAKVPEAHRAKVTKLVELARELVGEVEAAGLTPSETLSAVDEASGVQPDVDLAGAQNQQAPAIEEPAGVPQPEHEELDEDEEDEAEPEAADAPGPAPEPEA